METRNDRFPCHLGCRQPRVKQKGKLVGVGVDSNECSLLIMHFRGTGSWLLFMASANTKVTVTSSLIRKRSPAPPPSHPCGRVCGKHHRCLKSLLNAAGGGSLGEMAIFFVFCFHFGAEMSQLRPRRISLFPVFVCFLPLFLIPHKFFKGGTIMIPSISLSISLQTGTHLLNPRVWVIKSECYQWQYPPSSHCPCFGQPLLPGWLALGWGWEPCEGGGECCRVVFSQVEN